MRCMVSGGGCTHLATHTPSPTSLFPPYSLPNLLSLLLYPPWDPWVGQVTARRPRVWCWLSGRQSESKRDHLSRGVSFKLRPFLIAIAISIIALSAELLNLCKYLYILPTYMIMWLDFYFEKFQSMSLIIPPFQFRVAEISFYIRIPCWLWISVNEDYKTQLHSK